MTNCLTCGKCERDEKRNAVCRVAEGKTVPVLMFNLYDSESEFRNDLFNVCGHECTKYVPKSNNKKHRRNVEVEEPKLTFGDRVRHVGYVKGLLGCSLIVLAFMVPLYVYLLLYT